MSLPSTAVGPLKVETKPILMVSPASAGLESASAAAPASQNAVFIGVSPPISFQNARQQKRSACRRRFLAKSRPPASEKPSLTLEPSAQSPASTAFLHHNSRRPTISRTIVPVLVPA